MTAYLVLLLAVLSRFVPHLFHGVGLNVTAVSGGLLFFGSRRPKWQATIAALVMALSDVYLTCYVYRYPFHVSAYLLTWFWYGAICLLGSTLLVRITAFRVIAAVFSSATGFFLLSNFVVWASGGLYPPSAAGLMECYAAGVPFFGNDLVSTGFTASVLFGLPIAARSLLRGWQDAAASRSPLA